MQVKVNEYARRRQNSRGKHQARRAWRRIHARKG
nr:MAG TPA: hypothetical protein [Caudoviricetes sp.]